MPTSRSTQVVNVAVAVYVDDNVDDYVDDYEDPAGSVLIRSLRETPRSTGTH